MTVVPPRQRQVHRPLQVGLSGRRRQCVLPALRLHIQLHECLQCMWTFRCCASENALTTISLIRRLVVSALRQLYAASITNQGTCKSTGKSAASQLLNQKHEPGQMRPTRIRFYSAHQGKGRTGPSLRRRSTISASAGRSAFRNAAAAVRMPASGGEPGARLAAKVVSRAHQPCSSRMATTRSLSPACPDVIDKRSRLVCGKIHHLSLLWFCCQRAVPFTGLCIRKLTGKPRFRKRDLQQLPQHGPQHSAHTCVRAASSARRPLSWPSCAAAAACFLAAAASGNIRRFSNISTALSCAPAAAYFAAASWSLPCSNDECVSLCRLAVRRRCQGLNARVALLHTPAACIPKRCREGEQVSAVSAHAAQSVQILILHYLLCVPGPRLT